MILFPITRAAAKMTNLGYKMVKYSAQNRLSVENSSPEFQSFFTTMNSFSSYSPNIFKRAINWIKDFRSMYKAYSDSIKVGLEAIKITTGNTPLNKTMKKEYIRLWFNLIKESSKTFSSELNKLVKKK